MTQLSGTQIGDLVEALLHAYPSEADLAIMVRIELDQTLAAIAMGSNLRVIAFNLVAWADRSGYVDELVAGAIKQNPRNPALQEYRQRWPAVAAPMPTQPIPATKPGPAAIDIFLSYSSQNLDAMRVVEAGLRNAGLSVWTDEGLEAGTPSWTAAIEEAVGQAQVMVVLLSPAAKASPWVENEVALAQTLGKRVFPVLIEGDVRNAVPFRLISVQWVDGRQALRQAVEQVLATVARQLGRQPVARNEEMEPPAVVAQAPPEAAPSSPIVPNAPIAFDWVRVPAGEFLMGSDRNRFSAARDDEVPQHRVHLDEFYIARVPVTNQQYAAFVRATGYDVPHGWVEGRPPRGKGHHPAVNVSWNDAQSFCRWAGVCLPTEAQWEKAARGVDGRIYPWGDAPPDKTLANVWLAAAADRVGDTTPVDRYPAGASPYGVLDMAGNVWEWVADWYDADYYPHSPKRNPSGSPDGTFHVLRGGSWGFVPEYAASSVRGRHDADDIFLSSRGFRVVACASP